MDDLIYATLTRQSIYAHIIDDETGEMTDDMPGHMVEVFVPATSLDDINRNDDNRQAVAAAIKSAIDAYQAANG